MMNHKSLTKRKRKMAMMLLMVFLLGVCLLSSVFLINIHVQASVRERIVTDDQAVSLGADGILVLGAGVWDGGRPSPMLEDRLLQAIVLYEKGVSDRLLMSGDHGRKEYDEVNVMKQYAMDKGIPSEHIFMDHAGFSTYESLYRARDIFQVKKVIIVTQKYHIYRALYIAQRLGLEAYGVASDPRQYAGQRNREIREILARVKDFVNGIVQPKPSYLGETIPIWGNGDLTNDGS